MSHDTMLRDDSFRFGTSEWCTERKCRTFSSLLQHLPEAPWWYDISTSTGLHDKIQQIHTHFLQATSITTWGFTQQESERDHKRYPLPVSVQLQTSIITYHSCLYYEVIHAQLISPPMSLFVFTKWLCTSFNICCFLLRRYNTCVVCNRGIHCEDTWRSEGHRRLSTTTTITGV